MRGLCWGIVPVLAIGMTNTSNVPRPSEERAAVVGGTAVHGADRLRAIRESVARLRMVCTHECRTDWCNDPDDHDIVESANRNAESSGLEECGEHGGGCGVHGCAPGGLASDVMKVIEDVRVLGVDMAIEATHLVPGLVWNPDSELIQIIGCDDMVLANLPLATLENGQ